MAEESEKSELISDVWTQRSLGVDLSQDLGSVTHDDIQYISDHFYPFLQLVNPDAVFSAEEEETQFVPTSSGWTIHDYGEAISCSSPYGTKSEENIREYIPLTDQMISASEIAHLIVNKGWNGAELIGGSSLMQKYFWIESKRYGFEFAGYTPTEEDEKCHELLLKNAKENDIKWEKEATVIEPTAALATLSDEEPSEEEPTPTHSVAIAIPSDEEPIEELELGEEPSEEETSLEGTEKASTKPEKSGSGKE